MPSLLLQNASSNLSKLTCEWISSLATEASTKDESPIKDGYSPDTAWKKPAGDPASEAGY